MRTSPNDGGDQKSRRVSVLIWPFVALGILFLSYFAIQNSSNKEQPFSKNQTFKRSGGKPSGSLPLSEEATTESAFAVPPSRVSPDTVSTLPPDLMNAEIEVNAKHLKLSGSDGLYDRVLVEAKVPFKIKVDIPNLSLGQDIILSAPNGGKLSVADGSPLRFKAKANSQSLNLVFQPGSSPGAYSIIIMHQGVSQTLDFWVGPQAPLGLPGSANEAVSSSKLNSTTQNL